MGYLKTIAKGTSWSIFGSFSNKFLGYISIFLITHIVSPEQYGLFTLGNTIVGISATLAMLGLDKGILKYLPQYSAKQEYGKIRHLISFSFKIIIGLSCLIGLVIFLLRDIFAVYVFNKPGIATVLLIFSIIIPLNAIHDSLLGVLRSLKKIYEKVLVGDVIGKLSWVGLLLILFILQKSFILVLWAYVLRTLFSTILALVFVSKQFKKMNLMHYEQQKIPTKEVFSYSWPLFLHGFIAMVAIWSDKIMLGIFGAVENVGFYNVGFQLAAIMSSLLFGINQIFAPIISELYSTNKMDEYRKLFKFLARWSFAFALLCFSFFLLFGENLLNVFGQNYIIAFFPLIILGIGELVNTSVGSVGYTLMMLGKSRWMLYDTLFMATVNVILNYILIPMYGIIGAAIATSTAYFGQSVLWCIQSYKLTKVIPYSWKTLKPIFSATITLILGFVLKDYILVIGNKYLIVASSGIFVFIIYSLVTYLIIDKTEKDLLTKLINKLKNQM